MYSRSEATVVNVVSVIITTNPLTIDNWVCTFFEKQVTFGHLVENQELSCQK